MRMTRLNWWTLALVVVLAAVAAWYYPRLPDPVPTHWNAAGEVDGWTAKPWGVWLFPAITLGLAALMLVLPVISPRGFRLDAARRAYDIVVFVMAAFMLAVSIYAYRSAMGKASDLVRAVPAMIGILFIALGNYLGKFPKNFFVGIRTPWTLASDEVWNRTHRLGGRVFMAAGVVLAAMGFFGMHRGWFIATVLAAALVPALYSLVLYQSLHGFGSEED